ncbi:JAB1/Mov34/MPN/PAD-1 ubiquitin protease domain-containing protein [Phthorimaea operculella]|nr:JAB1/Mov34/MPN/PAD-1 ubiquitin protease domain-containing protein [Phthorimaea operculella]
MRIVFTGYYNGFGVEVRSIDEMSLLHHMGCFGKGTLSRSKPRPAQADAAPSIMRKRQFLKRNYWYKKFGTSSKSEEGDAFLKQVEDLALKIKQDCEASKNKEKRDVIDLVSSDEDNASEEMEEQTLETEFQSDEKGDLVVIVPNSDSEDDNYFANLKPKCCLNKIKVQEKLMLSLQEAFFLQFALGCLQIISLDGKSLNVQQSWDIFCKTDKDYIPKYVVYHYYRSKGYVVKPGIKFGGDFLLYKEGPSIAHAEFIVVMKVAQEKKDWNSILGHIRMATTTLKEIIIAEVTKPEKELNLPEDLNAFSLFYCNKGSYLCNSIMDRLLRLGGGMAGLSQAPPPTDAPVVDTAEQVYISSLALLKMLKHGRAGVPMEVMGLMLGEFVDDYTVRVIDVFAMPQTGTGVSVEAVDPVFQAKMLDMLKQTGRPEMVVGWYHSHPGFGCWLSGVDINTQQSFEALSERAVAVVVDPIQSVKGKVVIDAFRLINPNMMVLGQEPRQTTSNLGHLQKPSVQALIHGLNRHYYSISINYRKNELEQKMLLNLHKKSWMDGLTLSDYKEHCAINGTTVTEMLELAKNYNKALEDEEKMTPEQLAIKNVGKQDPKRHLEEKVDVLMSNNIVQNLGAMLDTMVFK